jgi:transketolase N-terminal domain/subunit
VIQSMDLTSINTIRTLSMDAVQAANSGHPGTPMAMAPVAYCLWQQFLRFDPGDPVWPNRDRFVLSIGHASMLIYSLLHLTEVRAVSKDYEILGEPSVPLDSIKSFRQLNSRRPGHPEYRWTSGVETTTGPLGQGVAISVGIAMARQWLAARYNCPGFESLFDFNVYALCGDGCMMEGVSGEAASLTCNSELQESFRARKCKVINPPGVVKLCCSVSRVIRKSIRSSARLAKALLVGTPCGSSLCQARELCQYSGGLGSEAYRLEDGLNSSRADARKSE